MWKSLLFGLKLSDNPKCFGPKIYPRILEALQKIQNTIERSYVIEELYICFYSESNIHRDQYAWKKLI